MIRLGFHGALLAEVGQEHLDAPISDCMEAVKLLEANRPGTCKRWLRRGLYLICVNGEPIDLKTMHRKLKEGDRVDFVPAVAGSGFWTVFAIVAAVISLAVSVITLFLSPKFEDVDEEASKVERTSNVNKEGVMVPIVYGQMKVKPVKVSSERVPGVNQSIVPYRQRVPWIDDGIALPDGSYASQGYLSSTDVTKNVLYAVSEGPVGSVAVGERKGVLLDDTQLESDEGTANFDGFRIETRNGDTPQELLNLIQGASTPLNVNTDLATSFYTRSLSANIDAARIDLIANSFFKTNKKNKQVADRVSVEVETSPVGAGTWTKRASFAIEEKFFDETVFQFTIDLDSSVQHDIRVRRTSEPVADSDRQNGLKIATITEVVTDKVSYDGTALLAVSGENAAYDKLELITKGRVIRVPSNYNPVTRAYTGLWDGTFKDGWSDNPYYIAKDVIENERYGLGLYDVGYDKYALYSLGQYADELVDDGKGGLEPRFTCSTALYKRQKAIKQLSDILATARSQYVWDGGQLSFFVERAQTPSVIAVNANVRQGSFTYQGKKREARKNAVTVSYYDPDNNYDTGYQTYRDYKDIQAHGPNETEIKLETTSAGQAMRMAKYTAMTDGKIVSFEGGPEYAHVLPGDLVEVYDSDFAGDRLGGLFLEVTPTTVTLDAPYTLVGGDEISCILPDGSYEKRPIGFVETVQIDGKERARITLGSPFTIQPQVKAAYGIRNLNLAPQQYIVQSRSVSDHKGYAIDCVEYDANKLSLIETGYKIENNTPTSLPGIGYVAEPVGIQFSRLQFRTADKLQQDLEITWKPPSVEGVAYVYDVYYQFEGQSRRTLEIGGRDTRSSIDNAQPGRYDVWVYARTASGQSKPATATFEMKDFTNAELEALGVSTNEVLLNDWFNWLGEIGPLHWDLTSGFSDDVITHNGGERNCIRHDPVFDEYEYQSGKTGSYHSGSRFSNHRFDTQENERISLAFFGRTAPNTDGLMWVGISYYRHDGTLVLDDIHDNPVEADANIAIDDVIGGNARTFTTPPEAHYGIAFGLIKSHRQGTWYITGGAAKRLGIAKRDSVLNGDHAPKDAGATDGFTIGVNGYDEDGLTLHRNDLITADGQLEVLSGFQFNSELEGWTGNDCTLSTNATSMLVTTTGPDPRLYSPTMSLKGSEATHIRVVMRRTTPDPQGTTYEFMQMHWETKDHGISSLYRKNASHQLTGSFKTFVFDMREPDVGGSDWVDNVITGIRFDPSVTQGDGLEIEAIHFCRVAPSSAARATANLADDAGLTVLNRDATPGIAQIGAKDIDDMSLEEFDQVSVSLQIESSGTRRGRFGIRFRDASSILQEYFSGWAEASTTFKTVKIQAKTIPAGCTRIQWVLDREGSGTGEVSCRLLNMNEGITVLRAARVRSDVEPGANKISSVDDIPDAGPIAKLEQITAAYIAAHGINKFQTRQPITSSQQTRSSEYLHLVDSFNFVTVPGKELAGPIMKYSGFVRDHASAGGHITVHIYRKPQEDTLHTSIAGAVAAGHAKVYEGPLTYDNSDTFFSIDFQDPVAPTGNVDYCWYIVPTGTASWVFTVSALYWQPLS